MPRSVVRLSLCCGFRVQTWALPVRTGSAKRSLDPTGSHRYHRRNRSSDGLLAVPAGQGLVNIGKFVKKFRLLSWMTLRRRSRRRHWPPAVAPGARPGGRAGRATPVRRPDRNGVPPRQRRTRIELLPTRPANRQRFTTPAPPGPGRRVYPGRCDAVVYVACWGKEEYESLYLRLLCGDPGRRLHSPFAMLAGDNTGRECIRLPL